MSQRQQNPLREEVGSNALFVWDTPERSSAARRSLGGARESWPRVSSAPRGSNTSELLPEEAEQSLGVKLLSGVARDSGARLSNPSSVPNNYKVMSIVLPTLWFLVGFGNCIPGPSFTKWQIGIDISPSQSTLLGAVVGSLPWNLKIFVAFMSDVMPIFGRRRLPYLVFGLALKGGAWFLLGVFGNHFTFPLLALQQFCATFGQMITGVMCDTLIVENVKYEVQAGKAIGKLQTGCWLWLSIGGLCGGLISGWGPQYLGISYLTMFLIDGAFHLVLLLGVLVFVKDPKFERTGRVLTSVQSTWHDMWETMKLVRVLKPLLFIIAFAMVPGSGSSFNMYIAQDKVLCNYTVSNSSCTSLIFNDNGGHEAAYSEFCNKFSTDVYDCNHAWGGLNFNTGLLAYMGILGSVGSVLGSWVYRSCFLDSSWHTLMASVVILATLFTSLQVVLCFRDPETGKTPNEALHIPDSVFALGDDIVMAASNQILSMPILVLMSRLCPEGAEGTVYAMVTSIQGVGGTVSGILSQICIEQFGVTNTNFHKMWQLILITSLVKLVSLVFLPLVPRNLEDQGNDRRHVLSGAFILCCFLGGLGWAFFNIITKLI